MKIQFSATIPPLKSAFQSDGDEAQVKMVIPKSDMAEALKLIAFGAGEVLRVTVEVMRDADR